MGLRSAATLGTSSLQYRDEEMEDAVTSNPGIMSCDLILWSIAFEWLTWGRMICLAAPPNIIDLPDDDEDVALKPRKSKKVTAGRMYRQENTTTPPARQLEDAGSSCVTFTAPLSSGPPALSTAPVIF